MNNLNCFGNNEGQVSLINEEKNNINRTNIIESAYSLFKDDDKYKNIFIILEN